MFERQPQENSILNNVEKQFLLAKKLESVYRNRPDLNSFKGAMSETKYADQYTKESIEKDKAYVKEIRKNIEISDSSHGRKNLDKKEGSFQLSEILQAMVVDRLNKNWFKECEAIMTSDFDDIAIGIDAVMKHKTGGYLGVSFDFTVTNKEEIIAKKIAEELKKIEQGTVRVVKYFEDPLTKQKGRLVVPKFIVGATKKDVEELAEAYLTNNKEILDNHPLKYVILLQIEEQLQIVLDYYEANKENQKIQFAKIQYEKIEKLIRSMRNEIHIQEKMHENLDLYEYTKTNIALETMKRFRINKK
jgi:hypothetical protein